MMRKIHASDVKFICDAATPEMTQNAPAWWRDKEEMADLAVDPVIAKINASITFKVDVAVTTDLVNCARQWPLTLANLPYVLREVMKVMGTRRGVLVSEQLSALVSAVLRELILSSVPDAGLQNELFTMLERLIDVYFSLSKGPHVFAATVGGAIAEGIVATKCCGLC